MAQDSGSSNIVRRSARKLSRSIMKSHRVRIPIYDMPVRLRPWFFVFTCVILVVLAFLGFTNFSRALPLNDKLLHFLCFSLATGVFYFIIEVEDDARRIWIWRHFGLIFTGVVCFFFGGILSEVVQSTLPYKTFQIGDVVANLCGSALGLYVAYHAERHYRHRREIARLYRPLDTDYLSEEDDDTLAGTQLLPTHNQGDNSRNKGRNKQTNLSDIWNEREEVFGIDSDEEADEEESTTTKQPRP